MKWIGLVLAAAGLVVGWAAMTPVASDDRDEVFEIPKGTWARRMSGDKVDILPNEVRLVLGVKDVLVLRNGDDVPQVFGPVLVMPGQTFRLHVSTNLSAWAVLATLTNNATGNLSYTVPIAPEPTQRFYRTSLP